MTPKKFAFNSFVRRQTADSPFSHWVLTDEQLLRLIEINFDMAKPGYRDGVCLVPVPPYGFFTGLVELTPGDELVGRYEARREGEEPRKSLYAKRGDREKLAAVAVDVVLYRHDVLAEDNDAETEAEWEIISINARTTLADAPIAPMTLMHNQFGSDGGTSTNMTPEQFETALRDSFEYWKNKAMLGP